MFSISNNYGRFIVRSSSFSPSHLQQLRRANMSGGIFSTKQKVVEDQWIKKHEAEVAATHKDVPSKPTTTSTTTAATSATTNVSEEDKINMNATAVHSGGSVRSAGGALGKREAAQEEKYFYEHDKEKLEKLKHHK